jgi:hypothetical protein
MLRAVSEILSDIFFPLFIATEGVLRKIQCKIDVHIVVPATAYSGWKRIHPRHFFSNGFDRLIDHDVPRRPHNLEIGNAAIFFDPDFCQCRKLCSAGDHGGWLLPFAIKAIVQHVAIPTCVGRIGSSPGFSAQAAFSSRRSFFVRFLFGSGKSGFVFLIRCFFRCFFFLRWRRFSA